MLSWTWPTRTWASWSPVGVAARRSPPVPRADDSGRLLDELETQGLGRRKILVCDDLNRTWARETCFERHRKKLPAITPQLSGKYAAAPANQGGTPDPGNLDCSIMRQLA